MIPTGSILAFAGAAAPTGFLLCRGQNVSQATYPDLYNIVGDVYSNPDTPPSGTEFSLPDLRGRVSAGMDPDNSSNRLHGLVDASARGNYGGTEAVVLGVGELPAHHHSWSNAANQDINYSEGGTTLSVTTGSNQDGALTGDTGNDLPHWNVQPTLILNFIIKT